MFLLSCNRSDPGGIRHWNRHTLVPTNICSEPSYWSNHVCWRYVQIICQLTWFQTLWSDSSMELLLLCLPMWTCIPLPPCGYLQLACTKPCSLSRQKLRFYYKLAQLISIFSPLQAHDPHYVLYINLLCSFCTLKYIIPEYLLSVLSLSLSLSLSIYI
jgi:hypothetical protein